jgi:membrane associated rhomboid family serine protease
VFPIRDHNPSGTFPYVTISLITINAFIFLYEVSLGRRLEVFLYHYGMVPYLVTHFTRIPGVGFSDVAKTFFTHMFLHAGWLHIIGNMWYLWIFGDNVEDRLGHLRFLFFYLICGLIAGLFQYLMSPYARVPAIGASGAIAGVLGAYFICFPRARVDLLIIIFFFVDIISVPAYLALVFWFAMQFFSGVLTLEIGTTGAGGVAWWAHIAGFAAGVLLIRILPKARRSRQRSYRVRFDR